MSVFDIKKSSAWNYSNSANPGFSTELKGVVVGLDNPQARDFGTGKPRFWDDGNPVRNIRVFVETDAGEKSVTFRPGGALFQAFVDAGLDSFEDLPGHDVTITTEDGAYNRTHPRPWSVELGEVNKSVKLHKVPVIDYDAIDPVTGRDKDIAGHDADIPF